MNIEQAKILNLFALGYLLHGKCLDPCSNLIRLINHRKYLANMIDMELLSF